IGRHHGAIGLSRDLSGFQFEGASTPVDLDGMLIEHMGLLSWVHERTASQNKKTIARWRDADRKCRSASGDPAMVLEFRMASILSSVSGILPRPAAGLLLDVYSHGPLGIVPLRMTAFGNRKPENSGRSCENA